MLLEIHQQKISHKDGYQKSGTEENSVRGLRGKEAWTFSLAPNNVLWSIAKAGRNVSGGADEMPEQLSSANSVPFC